MEKIIKQLSAKYKLDEDIIEKIIRSEFDFVKNTMEIGLFQSVHLHHLGKFCVKPNRLKQLEKLNESKQYITS